MDCRPWNDSRSHSRQLPGSTSYDSLATLSSNRPVTGRAVVGAGSVGMIVAEPGPGPRSASPPSVRRPGSPATTMTSSTAAAIPAITQPRRGGRGGSASSTSTATGSGSCSNTDRDRVTGVQLRPSHQRSRARSPPGSSYQPGGRASVTTPGYDRAG